MKFSIYLPTHNRYELVQNCLRSLEKQSHKDFEVFLHDNGSSLSVRPLVNELGDPRIHFSRSEVPTDPNDNAERVIPLMTGEVFLFLSDDDALVPDALDRVRLIMEADPKVCYLSTGLGFYDHALHRGETRRAHTGILEVLDAPWQALGYANGSTAIGARLSVQLPPEAHPSGIFIRMDLLRKTRLKQGRVFVQPFGDVGYLGCLLDTELCHHLDAPLAVIGDSLVRETAGGRPGQRRRLDRYRNQLVVSPLKGVTFINLALESHLKVLRIRSSERRFDLRIRPDFFRVHIREILGDSPKDWRTWGDLCECLPRFVWSHIQFANLSWVVPALKKNPILLTLNRLVRRRKQVAATSSPAAALQASETQYADIAEYAASLSPAGGGGGSE